MAYTQDQIYWAGELHNCQEDFNYLSSKYLRFKSKEVIGFPTLKFNPVQQYINAVVHDQWKRTGKIRQVWGKSRQVGSCLDPDTLVLKSDLTWVPISKLQIGDRVVAVDEFPPQARRGFSRRLRTATVEVKAEVLEPAFKLIMENGIELIATGEHRFLSERCFGKDTRKHGGTRWRAVKDMNQKYNCWSGQHTIRFLVAPWENEPDYEDGWIAGILDGEGCFRHKRSGAEINISQVAGPVFDRVLEYMKRHKYEGATSVDCRQPGITSKLGKKDVHRFHMFAMNEIMRLLGSVKPSRWRDLDWWDGKALPSNNGGVWPRVREIIPLGKRTMIDIQTSTGTFVANGFISHNSTFWRALSFHRTAFRDHVNALLVAHSEPDAMELFQLDTGFYDALPQQLRPALKYRSKAKMEFADRNSKLLVNHAQNMHVGASQMNHIVHLTEVSRYPNADQIQASLFPSISNAKGQDCSVVVIESTSRFGGNWFKEFAEAAQRKENEYEFHFVPWYKHDLYHAPVPKGFEPTPEERDLLRQHRGLTLSNLAWYRLKRAEYVTNLIMFKAEYPFTWEESWILPQGTERTFQEAQIEYMEHTLKAGIRHIPTSRGLQENIGGMVEVWEMPQQGSFYDIGVDVSGGQTDHADYTAIEVINRATLKQAAEVKLHIDPSSEEFFDLVYWLGRAYNSGNMVVDITGGWGHALMSDLQKRNYPNIWQWRRRDDAKEKVSTRLGFYYTKRDKMWLVHNAVKTVQRERPHVHSPLLLSEIRGFITIGIDEWSAAPGKHDDLVNAYMLALLGSTDERPHPMEALPPAENKVVAKPWAVHAIDEDLGLHDTSSGNYVERVLSVQ